MPKDKEQAKDHQDSQDAANNRPKKDAKGKKDKKLDKRLADLESEVEKLTEDVKRERADFMNYKRRSEMERMQIMQAAKAEVISQLLPIFDDLERALGSPPEAIADDPWVKGISQVYRQVQNKLSELGAERIDCLGKEFDPNLHEAVGYEDGGGSDEVVVEELRPGYMLGESVLRPSMVKVGNSSDNPEQPSGDEQDNKPTSKEENHE